MTFFTSGLCSGRDRTHRAAVSNYRPALRLSTSVNLAAAIRFRPAPSSHCQRLTSGFRNFLRCTLESLSLSHLGMNEFFLFFLNKIRGPAADSRDDRCGTEMDDSTRLMDTTTLNDHRIKQHALWRPPPPSNE